jgi:hypothetical protein
LLRHVFIASVPGHASSGKAALYRRQNRNCASQHNAADPFALEHWHAVRLESSRHSAVAIAEKQHWKICVAPHLEKPLHSQYYLLTELCASRAARDHVLTA